MSTGRGVIERYPARGVTRPAFVPGDLRGGQGYRGTRTANIAMGDSGAIVQGSGSTKQTGRLCGSTGALAEDGGNKPRKQKRTLKQQLHADLVALGYQGSYGRVAAFACAWRADQQREQQTSGRETFVPLAFQPGEAFQFDRSED